MNLQVKKVVADTVKKQGANFGKKYVICTVEDLETGDERDVPVFDKEAECYLACIAVQNGGTSATGDQPIPETKAVWKDCFDEVFIFPEPMVRVNEQGQPILNKFGQMYIRDRCNVLTRYNYDERRALLKDMNGNNYSPFSPRRGWDLTTRGTSVMNSFYVPLRTVSAQGQAPTGGPVAAPANANDLP